MAPRNLIAVEVAGFKSANRPVRLNFRDITVLAGANSTGKSTLMQPLLLIKQTLEKPFDPGGLAIDGPLVRFTHTGQFFSYSRVKHVAPVFSLSLFGEEQSVKLTYKRLGVEGVQASNMEFSNHGSEFGWVAGQEIDRSDASLSRASLLMEHFGMLESISDYGYRIVACNSRVSLVASGIYDNPGPEPGNAFVVLLSPAQFFEDKIQTMIYLPGLRGTPERQYVVSAAGPQFPGNFNDYVASIIHRWGATADNRLIFLENQLKILGLTSRVTTRVVDDTRVEVHVGRLPTTARNVARDTVNIADVGFGVSQTLPVVVALLAAGPGQIVYIEQPELHLHPKAQIAMAEILVHAADRGVRVVIETHSSLLLLALQSAVAEGKIAPDRMSLNWFTRDASGQTHVTEAQLDADGSYGDWPEDFGEIELKLQDRFMTAVERHHAK